MTRLVEYFFFPKRNCQQQAKIIPRCYVSICYSVSFQMLPSLQPLPPPLLQKHHSSVHRRLSAASDLLTLAPAAESQQNTEPNI